MNKYWIIGITVVSVLILCRFYVCKYFYKCALFNDILKEQTPDKTYRYSQGRVYLLLSIIMYYITLLILVGKSLKPTIAIDVNTVNIVIGALQWSILLMAGYSFGGKSLEVLNLIMNKKNKEDEPLKENNETN